MTNFLPYNAKWCTLFRHVERNEIAFTKQGCSAHHLNDNLIEGFDSFDDLTTPLLLAQEGQGYPKEHREEDDPQDVHVRGCCSNVVRDQITQKL